MSRKIFRSFFVLILVISLTFTGFTPGLAAPPTNDNFANAEAINSLPFSVTVDNTDATLELDEPVGCGRNQHDQLHVLRGLADQPGD